MGGAGKFLEREAGNLGDDIVDGRLERSRRRAAGDVVGDFIERVADREFCGDLGDRKAGSLRGQRRGARHARVHLDDDEAAIRRVDRELHIRPAGINANLAQHRDRGVAHQLVFLVGQGQGRRDRHRITGVHSHRIDILDRADDDAIVVMVTHDFELVLLPAEHRFLDQHFGDRRGAQPAAHDLGEFLGVVGDAAAGAAQGEGGPHDCRQADGFERCHRGVERVDEPALRRMKADLVHRQAKQPAVLGLGDGLLAGADQLDAVARQSAGAGQRHRRIERGLPAHRWQQGIRALAGDDLLDDVGGDRLDISGVGQIRIGHDRRRVRIDQDDPVALGLQRLAGLRAGIVELAGLADHDRPGADDQDAFYVGALRHQRFAAAIARMNRSNR